MNNINDKEIELVQEKLRENRENNKDIKILDEIDSTEYDNSNDKLEEGEGIYISDGVIMEASNNKEFDHFENIDSTIDSLIEDNIKTNLSDKYNLSEDDALQLLLLINKVRSDEKINVYENLPDVMKQKINDMANEEQIPTKNKKAFLNFAADSLIREFINDMELDAISIDFEKALAELVPTPSEMYSETNREYIENEFVKVAEKIEKDEPAKAKNLLDMRKGFIDAYKFEPMYELLNNSKVLKNIRRCNKIWSRIESEYLSIANVCKFTLYPLADIEFALKKIGFNTVDSKRLITLFVYTYTNGINDYKDPEEYNNIYRNSFANYFEANIKNLALSPNLTSDFSKEIKENINKLVSTINDNIMKAEVELSNKKSKKRG